MIFLWVRSIKYSPKLDQINQVSSISHPNVSIIVAARNEEDGIGRCIDSLLKQDYPNYELIIINDRSTDKTLSIVEQTCLNDKRVKIINLKAGSAGWVGNNWATFQGYLKSNGHLLLFSDADTYHSRNTLRHCVQYFLENKLDALNLLPRISAGDFFSKLIVPMYSLDRHTFCSPVDTNDPEKKAAYFNGVYYMIKRDVYQKIGTHECFKERYSADIFIGRKLKESKFKMKRVRGESYLISDTFRSTKYLFNQISRIMYRSYLESKLVAIRNTIALLVLEFAPLAILLYSIVVTLFQYPNWFPETVLLILSVVNILIMIGLCSFQSRFALSQNFFYGIAAPIAGCIFSFAYAVGLLKAIRKQSVTWRESLNVK